MARIYVLNVAIPPGCSGAAQRIEFTVAEKNRQVVIKGMDKESLGQIAADIRKIRPPEPYKGKGIHYWVKSSAEKRERKPLSRKN
jgi:large subunit ribosomal protein L6